MCEFCECGSENRTLCEGLNSGISAQMPNERGLLHPLIKMGHRPPRDDMTHTLKRMLRMSPSATT